MKDYNDINVSVNVNVRQYKTETPYTMPSEEFNQAAAYLRSLRDQTNKEIDQEILELYGLYKQVTVGDCNIAEPADDFGKDKFKAWTACKGKSSADAEKEYITRVNKLKK